MGPFYESITNMPIRTIVAPEYWRKDKLSCKMMELVKIVKTYPKAVINTVREVEFFAKLGIVNNVLFIQINRKREQTAKAIAKIKRQLKMI
jgi:hypothetical protein